MSGTQTGTVQRFMSDKGFGFIKSDADGAELFVHFSELQGSGFRNLEVGQRVEFTPRKGPKGMQASAVRVID